MEQACLLCWSEANKSCADATERVGHSDYGIHIQHCVGISREELRILQRQPIKFTKYHMVNSQTNELDAGMGSSPNIEDIVIMLPERRESQPVDPGSTAPNCRS